MCKSSKWAQEILASQNKNGLWGIFHALSEPNKKYPITTEQALRRLFILGYTKFYQVSLVADRFDEITERKVFDYILNYNKGIYYIYENASLSVLPHEFASKASSRYLGAIEILSTYKRNLGKLQFVSDWILSQKNNEGKWDMGNNVNDKVYFPLSDSWKHKGNREKDCTYRIEHLLKIITPIKQIITL